MSKIRYDEWYFYDEVKHFIKELDFTIQTYKTYIQDIYDDPNIEAKKYMNYLEENPSELESDNPDSAYQEIYDRGGERYYFVRNMKYRLLAEHINTIYQMFEQFIIKLIRDQLKLANDKRLLDKYENPPQKMDNCINFFNEYDFNLKNLNSFEKVDELRILQNVLKHGEGKAMKTLKNKRPDYFENNTLDFYGNTIIDDTLNITNNDLDEYVNSIKVFLGQFPKYNEKIIHKYEI